MFGNSSTLSQSVNAPALRTRCHPKPDYSHTVTLEEFVAEALGTSALALGASALDNTANNCPIAGQEGDNGRSEPLFSRDNGRAERFELREWAYYAAPADHRIRLCGRVPVGGNNDIVVRGKTVGDGTRLTGYAGLQTCGSVWACPVCSAKIVAERREELLTMMTQAVADGCDLAFVTFTVPHLKIDDLAKLHDALMDGMRAIGRNRRVKELRDELCFIGYSRVAEVTLGSHGWHPHLHLVYYFDDAVTQDELEELLDAEHHAWSIRVEKLLGRKPNRKASDIQRVTTLSQASSHIAEYMTDTTKKQLSQEEKEDIKKLGGLSWEMLGSQGKRGRGGSLTQWELMELAAQGDGFAKQKYLEFITTMKGKRYITHSQGVKDRFGIVEKTDDEIAAEEIGSEMDDLFRIPFKSWKKVIAIPRMAACILDVTQRFGVAEARRFCDHFDIATLNPVKKGNAKGNAAGNAAASGPPKTGVVGGPVSCV